MKFTELLFEARNFHKAEIDAFRKYTKNNAGQMHKVPEESKIKMYFNHGQADKITITKSAKMYNIIIDGKRRSFKNFNSLVKFLEEET